MLVQQEDNAAGQWPSNLKPSSNIRLPFDWTTVPVKDINFI